MAILRRLLTLAVLAGLGYLAYRFAGANADPTQVDLIWTSWETPLWLALLAASGLGAGLVAIWSFYRLARLGLATRRYRKAVRGLESEVHQLRSLPLGTEEPAADSPPGAA